MARRNKAPKGAKRGAPRAVQPVERRSGADRRRNPDRRTVARDTPDRRQHLRRASDRPPPKPSLDARTRKNLTLGLGTILSIPAIRTWSDGDLPLTTAAIRVAVAMAFAFIAVSAIAALIRAYMPEPTPDHAAPGEQHHADATVVDRVAEDADSGS